MPWMDLTTMSEFQFVAELPGAPYKTVRSPHRTIRPDTQVLIDFAEALRSRPMIWATWPRPLSLNTARATSARIRDGFYRHLLPNEGFESTVRDAMIYVRYNPERVTDARTLAFREGYAAGHKRGINDLSGIIERAFQSARDEIRDRKDQVRDV